METKFERRWKIPLLASYIGSIYMYTILSSPDRLLLTLCMMVVIGTLGYALYIIWKNYNTKERNQLFFRISIFAASFHLVTLIVNYIFQGLIGFLAGMLIIYLCFEKVVK